MLVYINDSRPCYGVFSLLIDCIATSISDALLLMSFSSPVLISILNMRAQNFFETLVARQSRELKISYHFESNALFSATFTNTETSGKTHVLTTTGINIL